MGNVWSMRKQNQEVEVGCSTAAEAVIKLLECPICLKQMVSNIELCYNGHSICGSCRQEVTSCPVCKISYKREVRNRLSEDISESLVPRPCKNASHGCKQMCLHKDLDAHHLHCQFRLYKCKLCSEEVSFLKLKDHCTETHPNDTCKKYVKMDISKSDAPRIILMEANNKLFWLYSGYNENIAYVGVSSVEEKNKVIEYICEIQIEGDDLLVDLSCPINDDQGLCDQLSYCTAAVNTGKKENVGVKVHVNKNYGLQISVFFSILISLCFTTPIKEFCGLGVSLILSLMQQVQKAPIVESITSRTDVLLKLLECPICLTPMLSTIELCSNGHSICGSCRDEVNSCPICVISYRQTSMRNHLSESISDTLVPRPCENESLGCPQLCLNKDMQMHYQHCPFRLYKCKVCNDEISFIKLKDHCKKLHSNNICKEYIKMDISKTDSSRIFLVEGNDKLFWLWGWSNENIVYVGVNSLEGKSKVMEYKCVIQIKCEEQLVDLTCTVSDDKFYKLACDQCREHCTAAISIGKNEGCSVLININVEENYGLQSLTFFMVLSSVCFSAPIIDSVIWSTYFIFSLIQQSYEYSE